MQAALAVQLLIVVHGSPSPYHAAEAIRRASCVMCGLMCGFRCFLQALSPGGCAASHQGRDAERGAQAQRGRPQRAV
jgi:hypothetical protein